MPVHVEVLTPLPEGWGMCQTCEFIITQVDMVKSPSARAIDSFPPEWQVEFLKTSQLILDLATKFGDAIQIILYDPRSLQGMFKAIRFGLHRYPAFIIEGKEKYVGWNLGDLAIKVATVGGIQLPLE